MIERKLTPKQQAFADFYIELGNATEAYVKAGYNSKGARANASRLITNDSIKRYIENRMEELKSERIADQQEVLETLTAIMRGEASAGALKGVGGGEEEVINNMPATMSERIRAAELIGKRHRMWVDKVETDGKARVVIVDDV